MRPIPEILRLILLDRRRLRKSIGFRQLIARARRIRERRSSHCDHLILRARLTMIAKSASTNITLSSITVSMYIARHSAGEVRAMRLTQQSSPTALDAWKNKRPQLALWPRNLPS